MLTFKKMFWTCLFSLSIHTFLTKQNFISLVGLVLFSYAFVNFVLGKGSKKKLVKISTNNVAIKYHNTLKNLKD